MLSKLAEEGAIVQLNGDSVEECLRELVQPLCDQGRIADLNSTVKALLERELLKSTAIGDRVAVPHARMNVNNGGVALAIGIHKDGLDFHAPDDLPVHILFMILSSSTAQNSHLAALARTARMVKSTLLVERLLSESTKPITILQEEEKKLS